MFDKDVGSNVTVEKIVLEEFQGKPTMLIFVAVMDQIVTMSITKRKVNIHCRNEIWYRNSRCKKRKMVSELGTLRLFKPMLSSECD